MQNREKKKKTQIYVVVFACEQLRLWSVLLMYLVLGTECPYREVTEPTVSAMPASRGK